MSSPIDEELMAAMLDPNLYPEPPKQVEFEQTHISAVFLADHFVYKIKKPVHFSFIDYSTLERRYFYCQEEVRLNSRLAQPVYLGVFPILCGTDGYSIGEHPVQDPVPQAVEYTIKMHRLPQDRLLEHLLRQNLVGPDEMRKLAAVLADFHQRASGEKSPQYGAPEAIGRVLMNNLDDCAFCLGDTLSRRQFDLMCDFTRNFIRVNQDLLLSRARDKMVREGHGDLRCEHICITQRIDIIDCVEFSEEYRYIDIASDIAFLMMDIDRLAACELGRELFTAYAARLNDPFLARLVNFYKVYRATVRGKVATLKALQENVPDIERRMARQEARIYFDAALRYAKAGSPNMIVVCGLSGTGKSTIAAAISERIGFEVINSDVVRKRLAGQTAFRRQPDQYDSGIYSSEFTQRTYGEVYRRAEQLLKEGHGVILDATFKDPIERQRFLQLSKTASVPIFFVLCETEESEVKKRLDARASQPDAASDATWDTYLRQKQESTSFGEEFNPFLLRVNGAGEAAVTASLVERFIADSEQQPDSIND